MQWRGIGDDWGEEEYEMVMSTFAAFLKVGDTR
jgi:hypothetical protein